MALTTSRGGEWQPAPSLSTALLRLLDCAALLTARRALSRAALSTVSLCRALNRAASSSVSTVLCTFNVAAPRTQPRRALSTALRALNHAARSQPHRTLNVSCAFVHSCARSQLRSLSLSDAHTPRACTASPPHPRLPFPLLCARARVAPSRACLELARVP